jgi:tetrahydromethanopterin S-methyltransferase subunit F
MLTPSQLHPKFDPADPVPRQTPHSIMISGVGQADTRPLYACAVFGVVGAILVFLILPVLWPVAMAMLCISCFGAWGILAKRTHTLDLMHRRAHKLRFGLRVARVMVIAIGIIAAVMGLLGMIRLLLGRDASL